LADFGAGILDNPAIMATLQCQFALLGVFRSLAPKTGKLKLRQIIHESRASMQALAQTPRSKLT
jgi:hypothetical protein